MQIGRQAQSAMRRVDELGGRAPDTSACIRKAKFYLFVGPAPYPAQMDVH
jgi:hypothetical protein